MHVVRCFSMCTCTFVKVPWKHSTSHKTQPREVEGVCSDKMSCEKEERCSTRGDVIVSHQTREKNDYSAQIFSFTATRVSTTLFG